MRYKVHFSVFILSICLLLQYNASAQNTGWLKGNWRGKVYRPSADSNYYLLSLDVQKIKGENFEGVLKTMKPADTSIHFDSEVKGIIKGKRFGMLRTRILYAKNDEQNKWKLVNCNNCKPPEWEYDFKNEQFIIRGAIKNCDPACDWISELAKDIHTFDSSQQEEMYALLEDNNKPQKDQFVTALNTKTGVTATTLAVSVTEERRIPILNAGGIVAAEKNIIAKKSTPSFTGGKPALNVSKEIYIPQRIVFATEEKLALPQQKSLTGLQNPQSAFAVKKPGLDISKDIYIPQRIVFATEEKLALPQQKNLMGLQNPPSASVVKKPGFAISKDIYIPQRIAFTAADENILKQQKDYSALQNPTAKLAAAKPLLKVSSSSHIPYRTPLIAAGNIQLLKRNQKSPIAQRTAGKMTITKPYLLVPDTRFTMAMITAAPVVAPKPAETAIAKALPLLPEGFDERKKNVVKTLLVNTDSVVLRVYDNGVVDGDIVSVIYNDNVVIDKLSLTTRIVEVKIPVIVNTTNSLVFHAHNLGQFPPNTAKLEIIYGNKREELTVSSDLTVSSTIDIVRK